MRRLASKVRGLGELVRRGGLRHPVAMASYARGRRQRLKGRPEEAARALRWAHEHAPEISIYGLQLAIALRECGRWEEAAEVLDGMAGRLSASDPQTLGMAGVEMARLGLRDEALAAISELGDQPDRVPWAALIQAALGDVGAVRDLVASAGELTPERWLGRQQLAVALEQAGEPSRALELVRGKNAAQEERLAATLRTYNPAWSPRLAGSRTEKAGGDRVLYLLESSLPYTPSGYGYRSRELLRALRETGLHPEVATRMGFPSSRGIMGAPPEETVDGVIHHRLNLPGVSKYTGIPLDERLQQNADWLLELVGRIEPAAIIAATPHLNGLLALSLREATGTPVIYDVRGFPEMTWATRPGGPGSEVHGLRREAETRCAAEADGVITTSGTMRDELASRGVSPDRITIVPQIVDLEAYSPRDRDRDLARSYGVEGHFVVGTITSLVDYEGINVLLRAVALARAEGRDIAALVVGDGKARPALEALAGELELGAAAVFAGRIEQEQVPAHYGLIDLFALPRRDLEVCRAVTPLKPFEALATGTPILVSDLPALAEIVASSGGGRTVEPESPEALAGTILELEGDRGERARLQAAAVEYALATNDRARAAESLRASFEAVSTLARP
ncbi:MAG TPA: glycosyltransferase [Solirubrobacterales bacterium]